MRLGLVKYVSKRHWLAVLILAGIALTGGALATFAQQITIYKGGEAELWDNSEDGPKSQQEAAANSNNKDGPGKSPTVIVNSPPETERSEENREPSNDGVDREKEDLIAQQEMARWARPMFRASQLAAIAAVLSGIFAGLGALFVLLNLREQRRLTAIQSRAYLEVVKVTAKTDGIDITDGKALHSLSIYLKNNGNTPALWIYADIEITFHPAFVEGETIEDRRSRGQRKSKYKGSGTLVREIPPKATYELIASFEGDEFPIDLTEKPTWRHIDPSIEANGTIYFKDEFSSEEREIKIAVSNNCVRDLVYPAELFGAHNQRVEEIKKDEKT